MLKYNNIDISEGIDVDKMGRSRECKSLLVFPKKNFSYDPFACDGCYDKVQRSTDFKDIAIVYIKNNVYRIYFQHMSKHKVKNNE